MRGPAGAIGSCRSVPAPSLPNIGHTNTRGCIQRHHSLSCCYLCDLSAFSGSAHLDAGVLPRRFPQGHHPDGRCQHRLLRGPPFLSLPPQAATPNTACRRDTQPPTPLPARPLCLPPPAAVSARWRCARLGAGVPDVRVATSTALPPSLRKSIADAFFSSSFSLFSLFFLLLFSPPSFLLSDPGGAFRLHASYLPRAPCPPDCRRRRRSRSGGGRDNASELRRGLSKRE